MFDQGPWCICKSGGAKNVLLQWYKQFLQFIIVLKFCIWASLEALKTCFKCSLWENKKEIKNFCFALNWGKGGCIAPLPHPLLLVLCGSCLFWIFFIKGRENNWYCNNLLSLCSILFLQYICKKLSFIFEMLFWFHLEK